MEDNPTVVPFRPSPDVVELRHLRAFVAVAEELNFSRAADRLYLSQPALSRQIRSLERLVGCQLLRRSTHRVELTLAGQALLDRAHGVLAAMDEAITATQVVGGELNERIMRMWSPFTDAAALQPGLERMREQFEGVLAQSPPPSELPIRPVNAGGVPALAVGEDPMILYLHGGNYVLGSAYGYRPLAGALADAAQIGSLVVDYRLAPEHPFPAALDDTLAAYRWLLARRGDPATIVLAADSSGAGLAIALLTHLVRTGEAVPAAAVLLCPAMDLSGRMLLPAGEPDAMDQIWRAARAALGEDALTEPLLRPLETDLTGLPPMLIQYAAGDRARPQAEALAERAGEHGVRTELELYPAATHVFHIHWGFLPEAADALQKAGHYIRRILTTAANSSTIPG